MVFEGNATLMDFLWDFLAPATLAQPCDPATTDEVCPDTTDWRRYFPLAVGNQWQYRVDRFVELDYDHGTVIVGTTEVDGESYDLAYEEPDLDPGIDDALQDFIAERKAAMPDANV